jgi:hypothetical protein
VALDALIGAVGGELSNGEFATIVDATDPILWLLSFSASA